MCAEKGDGRTPWLIRSPSVKGPGRGAEVQAPGRGRAASQGVDSAHGKFAVWLGSKFLPNTRWRLTHRPELVKH